MTSSVTGSVVRSVTMVVSKSVTGNVAEFSIDSVSKSVVESVSASVTGFVFLFVTISVTKVEVSSVTGKLTGFVTRSIFETVNPFVTGEAVSGFVVGSVKFIVVEAAAETLLSFANEKVID